MTQGEGLNALSPAVIVRYTKLVLLKNRKYSSPKSGQMLCVTLRFTQSLAGETRHGNSFTYKCFGPVVLKLRLQMRISVL